MGRPRRDEEWVPITARISADAGRRLRVAAARAEINQGHILQMLILKHLPAVEPFELSSISDTGEEITTEWLKGEMKRVGLSQSALATELGILPKSVSEWFERNRVPVRRYKEIRKAIAKARKRLKSEP